MIHNDTLNIWTHLAYFILILVKLIFDENQPVMILGLIGVSICMIFSSVFHTFRDQGPVESLMFLKFDLMGIVCMIMAISLVGIWMGYS
jgi:predicted membrane channel-forming protein YqfA (hemolysin III family)